jgi:hypothetical protein
MLERVALGQTRFATPGIAADSRGVAQGRYGLLLFPALDGAVGWLRLYSDEAGLEDLLAELKIWRLRSAAAARAFAVVVPATGAHALDRAARLARLWGGASFTGTARHFVRYRDEKSPYGYDVVDAAEVAGVGDLVLHGEDGSAAYQRDGDLDVRALVFRLSLIRVPGAERLDAEGRARLLLTVPGGLAAGVVRYLWKNRVATQVMAIHLAGAPGAAFAPLGSPEGHLLARVTDLPERILASFAGIPGVTIYRPVSDHVAVEIGYRHPVELSSCAPLFEADKQTLFSGQHDRVFVIAGPIELADARHLMKVSLAAAEARIQPGSARPADNVGLTLRLAPTSVAARRVVGTLIEWAEAPRLKKLVYALPPVLLRGHRVAASARGLVLVADAAIDLVPLGTLLTELCPGLLLPMGMELEPRVAPEVIAEALGHGPGKLTVFPHQGGPFHVADADFVPLERRVLAGLDVPRAEVRDLAVIPPDKHPEVRNDALGAFALWGYPAPQKPPSS